VEIASPTAVDLTRLEADYLELEIDDPTPQQVVWMICYNEACAAREDGGGSMKHINLLRRWLAQFIDLPPQEWKPIKRAPAKA